MGGYGIGEDGMGEKGMRWELSGGSLREGVVKLFHLSNTWAEPGILR